MKNISLINLINLIFILIFIITAKISPFTIPPPDEPPVTEESEYSGEDNWALYLINSENPLSSDFKPHLKNVYKKFQLDFRCADSASEMIRAAENDGIELVVCSAYRSFEKQEKNFKEYIDFLTRQGYSYEQAVTLTEMQIAYPAESEHNAGLALDIITADWFDTHIEVTADFENTDEFKWLEKNSYKFGFILRYPKGAEEITGFDYEPWHYRYVGISHAEQIYFMDITLEDYVKNYYNLYNIYNTKA